MFAIEGLDTASGLSIVGRDTLYRKLLALFCVHAADFQPRFEAFVAAGDLAAVLRLAHDLRCNAATLGAFVVGKNAGMLEMAAERQLGVSQLRIFAQGVADVLTPLLQDIASALAQEQRRIETDAGAPTSRSAAPAPGVAFA